MVTIALTAMGISLVLLSPAQAGVEISGQLAVVSSVNGPQSAPLDPAAAYDETLDRYLVVWLQEDDLSDTTNVWGRFLTPDGTPVGAPFLAAAVGTGVEGRDARSVEVAYDPVRRQYLVVMVGLPNASLPDETGLFGQWLDDQGERVGRAVGMSPPNLAAVRAASVVADPERDRFVMTYVGRQPSTQATSAWAQLVRFGNIGRAVQLTDVAPTTSPSVSVRRRDGAVIVTTRAANDAGQVVVATLTEILNPAGTEMSPAGATSGSPAVASRDDSGGALIAWPEAGELHGVAMTPDGQLGSATSMGTLQGAFGLTLLPLQRSMAPWMALSVNAAGDTIFTQLVGGAGGAANFPIAAVSGAVDGREAIAAATDSTRQWVLVPYAVWNGTSRAVAARVIAAPLPPDAPLTPLAAAEAEPRCPASAQLYTPAAGSVCAPPAVSGFTVAPIMDRKRRSLLGLAVTPTVRSQRVRVECVASCGRLRPVLKRRGTGRATDVMFGRWRTPVGGLLEVRVEQPDRTTRYRRFSRLRRFPFLEVRDHACRLPIGVTALC